MTHFSMTVSIFRAFSFTLNICHPLFFRTLKMPPLEMKGSPHAFSVALRHKMPAIDINHSTI